MVTELIKKNRNAANIIIMFLLFISILIVIFELFDVKKVVIQKRHDFALLQRDYLLLDQMLADKKNESAKIEKVMSSLPQSYMDIGSLSYKIENAARDKTLESEMSYDKDAKDEKGFRSVKLLLTTKGGFKNYTEFISAISKLPYNTDIDGILADTKEGVFQIETAFKIFTRK